MKVVKALLVLPLIGLTLMGCAAQEAEAPADDSAMLEENAGASSVDVDLSAGGEASVEASGSMEASAE